MNQTIESTEPSAPANVMSSASYKRALLVYPEFPTHSYWNFRLMRERIFGKNKYGKTISNFPPLGLLCIVGPISEVYGRENVRMVDINVKPLTDEDLEWADDVYISAMLIQNISFDEVARRAKEAGKTVIGGGPYVDKQTPNVDFAFINESDSTLKPFLKEFMEGTPQKYQESDERPEEDEFLRPDYSWIKVNDYGSQSLQYSRGCPHDCEFCDITVRFGRKMRTKDVSLFLEELDMLYDAHWRGAILIIDDNFIGKKSAAEELLKELAVWQKAHRYPFQFITQATLLLAEDQFNDMLKLFKPAGFSMVFFGIESPNEDALKETNKFHNVRPGMTITQKIRKIQKEGELLIIGGFIVGFDSDDKNIFDMQEKFINEQIMIPTPMVGILEPLPYTHLEARMKKEGRMLQDSHGSIASTGKVVFQPKNFTPEELEAGYKKLVGEIYLDMGKFFNRCKDAIKYVPRPPWTGGYRLEILKAMVNLLVHEGIYAKSRWKFWGFMMSIVMKYPYKLPYAFRLAAWGLHYRIITEKQTA